MQHVLISLCRTIFRGIGFNDSDDFVLPKLHINIKRKATYRIIKQIKENASNLDIKMLNRIMPYQQALDLFYLFPC